MKRRKTSASIVSALLLLLMTFFQPPNVIHAAATDSDLNDTDQTTVQTVPRGLLLNNYFTIKNPTNNANDNSFRFKSNSAFITNNNRVLVLAHGDETNTADNTSGLLTGVKDATGSYGAAWSNMSTAYFKPTEDQTISAWLSFGSGDGLEKANGQGMALVFQNNPDGATEMGAGQQGLGVYGYDKSTANVGSFSLASTTDVAKTAIQNSIALEFDTQLQDSLKKIYGPIIYTKDLGPYYASVNNYDAKDTTNISLKPATGFPTDTSLGPGGAYGHIAFTYPANPLSYVATRTPYFQDNTNAMFSPFKQGYSLFHIGSKTAELTDDYDANGKPIIWHHLTVNWHPSADNKTVDITYLYNDKLADGSINTKDLVKKTETLNMSELGTITKDSEIYWGFTGSNNNIKPGKDEKPVASKLVAVESIPNLVNANVKTTITDKTLNKIMYDDPDNITTDGTDRQVADGDNLLINYKLNYVNGREDWKDIVAKISLPTNIDYDTSNNVIGTLTYSNGDTESIPATAITTDATTGVKTINYSLLQNLGDHDAKSKVTDISINGVANNKTKKNITVTKQPATFTGYNDIQTTSTPSFTIRYKKDWTMNLKSTSDDPINLLYQQEDSTLNLGTTLSYNGKDSPAFAKDDPITYTIKLGDDTFTYSSTVAADRESYADTIPLRKIIEDAKLDFWDIFTLHSTRQIIVTAADKDGIIGGPVTYNVKTEPNHVLKLTVSNKLDFQNVNFLSSAKYLRRKGDFTLSVTSYHNPWTLAVSTSELKNNENQFNGILVNHTSELNSVLTNNYVEIAQDDTSYDTETVVSIPELQKWTADSGILIKPSGLSKAGTYNGTMTWTLISDSDTI